MLQVGRVGPSSMAVSGCGDQLESERCVEGRNRWEANRQDGGLTCVQRNVRYCLINGGVRSTVSDQAWSVLAPTFDALTPRGPRAGWAA